MSIGLMSLVFKADIPDLEYTKDGKSRRAKASTVTLLLLAYADHANEEGEGAYPGYDRLEKRTKLSRQGIADTITALKQNKYMVFTGISKAGTNTYRINKPLLLELVKPLDSAPDTRVKPLDSGESSHLTQTSQATGLKPSVKPSVKPERGAPAPDFEKITVSEAKQVPTIKLYTDATNFFPPALLWGYVHKFITEHKLSKEKIKQAAIAWNACGFKQENIKGILEWAAFGIPDKYKTSTNGQNQKTWTPIPDVDETRRRIEEREKKYSRSGAKSIQDVMAGMQKG